MAIRPISVKRPGIISLNIFFFISIINSNYFKKIMPVNCLKCTHFKITWIKTQPYGCTLFGFKSKALPSVEVYTTSGKECTKFTPKVPQKK